MNKLLSLLLVTTCFTSTLLASAVEDNADGSSKRLRTITPETEGDMQERSLKRHKDFNSVNDDSSSSSASSSSTQMSEEEMKVKYQHAKGLLDSPDPDEKASGLEILKGIANHAAQPDHQLKALNKLWGYGNCTLEDTEERAFARPFITTIATTDSHPKQYEALFMLYDSDNPDDKAFACDPLKRTATIDGHPNQFQALTTLYYGTNKDDNVFAYDQLKRIATTDKHPHQVCAIRSLCISYKTKHKEFARAIVRQLRDLDGADSHQQRDIIQCLRESNNPQDKSLALHGNSNTSLL